MLKHTRTLFFVEVILLLLTGCVTKPSVSTYIPADFQVLSVKEYYLEAQSSATNWQENAYLHRVSQVAYLHKKPETLSITYFFLSKSYPEKIYSYRITISDNGTQKIEEDSDILNTPRPFGLEILPEQLPFDSLDALKIMYDALGEDFFESCKTPSPWYTSVSLSQKTFAKSEGPLTWSASFSCDKPESMSAIFIDAYTGEVIEVRR